MVETKERLQRLEQERQAPPPCALHYTGYDEDYGGVTAVIKRLAAAADFPVVLGGNPGFVQRQAPQLPVEIFPRVEAECGGLRQPGQALRVARHARGWLRRNRAGIFHAHSRVGLLAAALLAAQGERRVVGTVHVLGRQRWFFRLLARVLGPRLFWLSPHMPEYYGLGRKGWESCLPDCIIAPAPARTARGAPLRFGAVGPFAAVKQWDLLLEGWARVPADRRAGAKLIHIGGTSAAVPDPARERLQRRAAELGVADSIEWRPRLVPLDGFWAEIDCLLVVSRHEAFGVAALEALAAGVPVLTADAAGTRDLVAECGGGMFAADSAAALAAAITALRRDGIPAGWAPRPEGLERFHATASAARHREIYRALLRPAE